MQRCDEVLAPGLLEQVAAGAGDDGSEHGFIIGVRGEHQDFRVGALGADLAAGLDAAAVGEADVHDDDVWLAPPGLGDGGGDGIGLADEDELGALLDQRAQSLPHHVVVVDDEYADLFAHAGVPLRTTGTETWTSVPFPGAERTSRAPPSFSTRARMLRMPWPAPGVVTSKP